MKINFKFARTIIMVLAFFISCTSSKDIKAVNRVIGSRPLLNQVKPYVDSLWPCIPDTAIKVIKGGVDSVPYPVYIPIDTSQQNKAVDSLIQANKECKETAAKAYKIGFETASKLYEALKVPIPRPDTVIRVNNRGLDICNAERIKAIQSSAVNESLAAKYKSERNTLFFALLVIILLVGIGLFFKFKP